MPINARKIFADFLGIFFHITINKSKIFQNFMKIDFYRSTSINEQKNKSVPILNGIIEI